MTFDKEFHKQVILEMLARASCPVPFIEQMREIVEAVKSAEIAEPAPPPVAAMVEHVNGAAH